MRAWFRGLPIRSKLITMLMTTSVVVLAMSSGGHLYMDYSNLQKDAEADLYAQAYLLLDSANSAIKFDVDTTAQETIDTIQHNPTVRAACLWDEERVLIARLCWSKARGHVPPRCLRTARF